MTVEEKMEAAEQAITNVFCDQSVSQAYTKEKLSDLIGYIQDMLNTLPE